MQALIVPNHSINEAHILEPTYRSTQQLCTLDSYHALTILVSITRFDTDKAHNYHDMVYMLLHHQHTILATLCDQNVQQ